jgi:hypothetical protein
MVGDDVIKNLILENISNKASVFLALKAPEALVTQGANARFSDELKIKVFYLRMLQEQLTMKNFFSEAEANEITCYFVLNISKLRQAMKCFNKFCIIERRENVHDLQETSIIEIPGLEPVRNRALRFILFSEFFPVVRDIEEAQKAKNQTANIVETAVQEFSKGNFAGAGQKRSREVEETQNQQEQSKSEAPAKWLRVVAVSPAKGSEKVAEI